MYADNGRRTPVPGYQGFLPGYYSGNLHGASVQELVTPEKEKRLRLKTKRGRETRMPWETYLLESGDRQSSSASGRVHPHPFQSEPKDSFLPKKDRAWTPPISGYGGHMPGYASRNSHGAPWRELIVNEWASGSPLSSPARSGASSPHSGGGSPDQSRVRPWRNTARRN